MSKKNYTVAEFNECHESASNAGSMADDLISAIDKCKVDMTAKDSLFLAQSILCHSQSLSRLSGSLISHYRLQLQRESIAGSL